MPLYARREFRGRVSPGGRRRLLQDVESPRARLARQSTRGAIAPAAEPPERQRLPASVLEVRPPEAAERGARRAAGEGPRLAVRHRRVLWAVEQEHRAGPA